MLRKVIDEFDIDTYGWFNEDFKSNDDTSSSITFRLLTKPASDIWSLWVKQPTQFHFVEQGQATCDSLLNLCSNIEEVFRTYRNSRPFSPGEEANVINMFMKLHRFGYQPYSYDNFANACATFDFSANNPRISLPNYLVNPAHMEKVGDNYLLADAITGVGLEALVAHDKVIPPLARRGINKVLSLNAGKKETTTSIGGQSMRTTHAVVCDCTLDIWWALQVRDIRTHILSVWPGWSDIFSAQDTLLMPAADSMQSYVSKKSPYRSPLRRFCMTLAWNINPHNTRLKFPPHMEDAYNSAVTEWTKVTAASPDNGDQLQAIHDFVIRLTTMLDSDEEVPSKSVTQSGSNLGTLTNSPLKNRSFMRGTNRNETTLVTQRTEPEDTSKTPISSGVIFPPSNWSINDLSSRKYRAISKQLHDKCRKSIADEISASAWFVPNPPPLEHGNLDGQLDEGNLLRYAAFSDPTIFSVSPESGAGQIVLGILVDSSGSMNAPVSHIMDNACAMQAACCFVGGVRDGLSRNPNVKVCAFAYDSRNTYDPSRNLDTNNERQMRMHPQPADVRHDICVCALRRLDTDEDLLNTEPHGGTPTSSALLTLDAYLTEVYPEAQRVILVLTDGAPCGWTQHPFFSAASESLVNMTSDSPDQVRRTVSAISTPIFCVGINVGEETLRNQYNVGHSFTVDSPFGAVKVACDLVRGIGQSLNC